jgi:outer membrane protein assembly factor BamA
LLLLPLALAMADPMQPGSTQIVLDTPAEELKPALLDHSGATIGSITIENGGIFDLGNAEEDKALYRLANRIHVTTRPEVIEQQLLFGAGDSFSAQAIEETERILRSNRFIQEASIEAVEHTDGVVDIRVSTSDVWTLAPKLKLSRTGGQNSSGFGIRETNLLGTGMQIEAMYESDVDRDSKVLKFADHNIRNSWYGVMAIAENNSDGHTYGLDFGKPFYSLESRSAHGFGYFDNDQVESFYDHGEVGAQFRHQSRNNEVFAGWSKGLQQDWSKRYLVGLAYAEDRFSAAGEEYLSTAVMPSDRKLLYPFVGIELLQNKYEKTQNLDQINRIEDRHLGTSFRARLGLAQSGLGSDRDAWLANIGATKSFGDAQKSVLFLSTALETRVEAAGIQNLTFDVDSRYYRRQSDRRLFFAALSATYGYNLDLDKQIQLGGDNGLRGYPLRYQSGDKRILLTLEQRIFTDWYPWRLLRLGGAIFFDAGRVWGSRPLEIENDGVLKDIGVGLRIGNPRSGLGRMAHIDVAFPLDGNDSIKNVQFLVKLKQSF